MNINTVKLTPEIYSKESRDFQLFLRLYDTIFNNMKMGSDILPLTGYINNNFDSRLLALAACTNGFITKHIYDNNDLYLILSSFKSILKKKGTKEAVEIVLKVLLKSQSIKTDYRVIVDLDEYQINIYINYALKDLILLQDLFEYILPTGFTYRLYKYSKGTELPTTNLSLIQNQPISETQTTVALSEIVREDIPSTDTQIGGNINTSFVVGSEEGTPEGDN